MTKKRKYLFSGLAICIFLALTAYYVLNLKNKSYSPEDTVSYSRDGLELEVFYNRPYKNDRVIFGKLVPYGQVWRTGANEATTFETNKDILVDGSYLEAGKYTLWTIPMEESWKVIFNSEMYDWGITNEGLPSREAEYDVLQLELPVHSLPEIVEQFSIYFQEEGNLVLMILAWDQTQIRIPLKEDQGNQSEEI